MRRLWLSDDRVNVRIITAESQCMPMLSRGGFKRLRRTQCDGGRVGSRPDSTMSEDRGLLDSLAHDLEFDGDVPTIVREVDATMHDGSLPGPSAQVLSTVPASSGAVRQLVLVRNSEDVHSTVPVAILAQAIFSRTVHCSRVCRVHHFCHPR